MVIRRGSPLWRLYSLCLSRQSGVCAASVSTCGGPSGHQWTAAVTSAHLLFTSAQGESFRFIPGTVVQHLQTDDEVHAVLAAAKTVVP